MLCNVPQLWHYYKCYPQIWKYKTSEAIKVYIDTLRVYMHTHHFYQLVKTRRCHTYTLSPLTMYNPSTTCSTPCEELKTRSWLSSKIKLMVWSKPLRVPWKKTHKKKALQLPFKFITFALKNTSNKVVILRY